jgi:hypothetical protein
MTTPTAPGVTHRWTSMTSFTDEIASARIWAGFHYRFSTRVGTQMGLQVGDYVMCSPGSRRCNAAYRVPRFPPLEVF